MTTIMIAGKKYKIAPPHDKRVRPKELGLVNFGPVCSVCNKPIQSRRGKKTVCSIMCGETRMQENPPRNFTP